ncbi:GntR family transcriptional regulator [Nocardioides carbamazepini]|uniref:GntR family transcriptional regulator n=1 Tax=Nocardioides carbamazepini TaxID=2854259 RepID=UPI002149BBA6|nr:GntR family transcriptional regulator [Nocardioides carbamazepini]MCR1781318.1 GntR family transcriptional regulator [Nocardioides carbamazepini]
MSTPAAKATGPAAAKPRLADQAYERLVELVVSGLPAGSRLSETELATTLGMSKTPVREALLRLESEGLVSPIPHVGYLIPHLSYLELREALEVREAVEGYLAMLATDRIGDAELTELRETFDETAARLGDDPAADIEAMKRVNDLLHGTILRAANNAKMEQILATVRNQVNRGINELIGKDERRYRLSFDEHVTILEALESRDPAQAERAMRTHVESVNIHILRRFR